MFDCSSRWNNWTRTKKKKTINNNNKQFHHVRCSIEYPTLTFSRSARCSIIKNENGIKYENMKFWNGFSNIDQRPIIIMILRFSTFEENYAAEYTLRSIRFPFLCSNHKSNAFTHNYYYIYLLWCIWYSGRRMRARWTCCYDEHVHASIERNNGKKENNI